MTAKGAKALARHLHDEGANPPVFTRVASNGPDHESVVHVTFGMPKSVEHTDRDGNVTKIVMPRRPRPYTVS